MSVPTERYQLRWRITGSGQEWQTRSYVPNGQALTIPSLEADKTYDIEARSVGINKRVSAWVAVTKLAKGNNAIPNINDTTDKTVSVTQSGYPTSLSAETMTIVPVGSTRTIRVDYSYFAEKSEFTTGTSSITAQSVTGVIERSTDSGSSWSTIGGWSASGYYSVESEPGFTFQNSSASGSGIATDDTVGGVAYRARVTGNTLTLISGATNQATISLKVEQ